MNRRLFNGHLIIILGNRNLSLAIHEFDISFEELLGIKSKTDFIEEEHEESIHVCIVIGCCCHAVATACGPAATRRTADRSARQQSGDPPYRRLLLPTESDGNRLLFRPDPTDCTKATYAPAARQRSTGAADKPITTGLCSIWPVCVIVIVSTAIADCLNQMTVFAYGPDGPAMAAAIEDG